MKTEIQCPQSNQGVSQQGPMRCPHCGSYYYGQKVIYRNPQTGEQIIDSAIVQVLSGCLVLFVGYIVSGLVIELIIAGILFFAGHLNDPLYADIGMVAIPFAIVVGALAIPFYFKWREIRFRKKYITVRYYTCWQCKYMWTIIQQPPVVRP